MEQEHPHIKDLLEGCLRHDRASQKLLYQQFYSYGMGICLRYGDNRDEASEILNDGYMKLFSNLEKFDLTKPFKPWLRKILVNTSINFYHKKQLQIHTEEIAKIHNVSSTESILSGINYEEVVAHLQKLSPAYRTVFNLYVIEGYTHMEIASKLQISVGTSKSNLFKAKEQLKKILNDFFEADYVRTR